MKVFDILKQKALSCEQSIVFPEGNDLRVLEAVCRLKSERMVNPILLGDVDEIKKLSLQNHLNLADIRIINPLTYNQIDEMIDALVKRRNGKNTAQEAAEMLKHGSYFGTMLVYLHKAAGMVSGAAHSTADTVRPALQIIKTLPGMSRVSGAMIMERETEKYIFSDCAINIDPDAQTLAEIAYQSYLTAKMIGLDPKVAMLSFSTKGSAKGPMIDKVIQATKIVHETHPEVKIDGELQFDAAFVANVAAKKAPNSEVAGKANVFVFPELQSGNIGYKIAQRLGNFTAVGPVLQGLAAPINDLSRGCSANDVYLAGILTAVQAIEAKK